MNNIVRGLSGGLAIVALVFNALAGAQEPPAAQGRRTEAIENSSGQRVVGRIAGDAESGFRFVPDGGGDAIPLEPGVAVAFDGPLLSPLAALPPFHVVLGTDQRLSGRLEMLSENVLQISSDGGRRSIAIARGGALALLQRPGETQVLTDGFENIDDARWAQVGDPELVAEPHLTGTRSLRLPPGGTSLTCRLPEPVGSGRVEVAYHDSGARAPGHSWFVDLTFRTAAGPQPIRAMLGWEETSLAVESLQGPTLAVQRLARVPGWHRLVVRFGPGGTELAVDGNELAHGNAPDGPLMEIRLATHASGNNRAPEGLAAYFDDLTLARLSEPAGDLEIDPSQDELRLVGGDQLYGRVQSADAQHIAVQVAGKPAMLPWTEVAGLYFRRVPAQSAPVEGLLVRVEWRSAPGNDPHDVDRLEGALATLSPTALELATPYAGTVSIPRDQIRRLQVLGHGRRIVIDPSAHHLGDSVFSYPVRLDPPQPQNAPMEVPFELDKVPPGKAYVVLDVLEVTPEEGSTGFSALVKKGELRTHVLINGSAVDYINRYVTSKNESVERIRVPLPDKLLKPGKNTLRIKQDGEARSPESLDDLGILGVALEFTPRRPEAAQGEKPGP